LVERLHCIASNGTAGVYLTAESPGATGTVVLAMLNSMFIGAQLVPCTRVSFWNGTIQATRHVRSSNVRLERMI
jgi:hypothetical protein